MGNFSISSLSETGWAKFCFTKFFSNTTISLALCHSRYAAPKHHQLFCTWGSNILLSDPPPLSRSIWIFGKSNFPKLGNLEFRNFGKLDFPKIKIYIYRGAREFFWCPRRLAELHVSGCSVFSVSFGFGFSLPALLFGFLGLVDILLLFVAPGISML